MTETYKTCRNNIDSGIWMSTQFRDEKVFLFCSDKCPGEYIKMKLERIKSSYLQYYNKLMKDGKERLVENYFKDKKYIISSLKLLM